MVKGPNWLFLRRSGSMAAICKHQSGLGHVKCPAVCVALKAFQVKIVLYWASTNTKAARTTDNNNESVRRASRQVTLTVYLLAAVSSAPRLPVAHSNGKQEPQADRAAGRTAFGFPFMMASLTSRLSSMIPPPDIACKLLRRKPLLHAFNGIALKKRAG